jgi:hypothetical protein
LPKILQDSCKNLAKNLARFLQQLERLFKSFAPNCIGQNINKVLEKSRNICETFLQEISKKSRKNLDKNLARFL